MQNESPDSQLSKAEAMQHERISKVIRLTRIFVWNYWSCMEKILLKEFRVYKNEKLITVIIKNKRF
jgi:hypothetical protein